jgi:hypothetical protein
MSVSSGVAADRWQPTAASLPMMARQVAALFAVDPVGCGGVAIRSLATPARAAEAAGANMDRLRLTALLGLTLLVACEAEPPPPPPAPPAPPAPAAPVKSPEEQKAEALQGKAKGMFQPLPAFMDKGGVRATDDQIALGRALYYETRLSKSQEISCNSCHDLAAFGVDNKPTSPGHKGQLGGRIGQAATEAHHQAIERGLN